MNLQDKVRDTIKSAISAGEFLTLKDIASRAQCSIRTAHTVRASLAASGEIPPSFTPRRGGRHPSAISAISKLIKDKALSTEEQRGLMSQLILTSPNDNIKVAAQNALTRLDAQSGANMNIGPGTPLTEEARVNHLSSLMRACGLVTVRTALKSAFPKSSYAETLTQPESDEPQGTETPIN